MWLSVDMAGVNMVGVDMAGVDVSCSGQMSQPGPGDVAENEGYGHSGKAQGIVGWRS